MKNIIKYLYISFLLSNSINLNYGSVAPLLSCCSNPQTVFVPISQGQNLYTQYHKTMYLEDDNCWTADLSLTYRFSQTMNSKAIAPLLNGTNPMLFKSGGIPNVRNDLPADANRSPYTFVTGYFGLPRDSVISLCFTPRIRNNIFDFQLALGREKLWFQINLPVVNTNWQINKGCSPEVKLGVLSLDDENSFNMSNPVSGSIIYTINGVDNTGLNKNISSDKGGSDTTYINPYLESNADVTVKFSKDNTKMGIGYWTSPDYGIELTPFPTTVLDGTAATPPTKLTVTQIQVDAAKSITQALGIPGFNFGDVKGRTYNLYNFGNCTSKWGLADIIMQLGWDFCKTECKNLALYIRAVAPTGTNLNKCWLAQGLFSPIVGNGKHFELGIGINAYMTFYECDESDFKVYLDGYVTHMFSSNTFRSFDSQGLPMSRYGIVKNFTKDDDGSYLYAGTCNALGDVMANCINVSCSARSEIMLDLIYSFCNWQIGLGYAFSGQSAESNSCTTVCPTSSTQSIYYGFKGLAAMSNFIIQPKAGSIDDWYTGAIDNTDVTWAASLSNEVVGTDTGAYKYGIPQDSNDSNIFTKASLQPNSSGLMGAQILNKIFAHIDYVWADSCWQPELGILGSVGFGSGSKTTAQYWDIGARFGLAY